MLATCSACEFDPRGLDPASPDYHRAHRDQHLARFPSADLVTRAALDHMVKLAERGAIVTRRRAS